MMKKWSSLFWVIALLFVILSSGCAAFLEDYNYSPVGSNVSSDRV